MCALPPKAVQDDVRFGPEADIQGRGGNVRFGPSVGRCEIGGPFLGRHRLVADCVNPAACQVSWIPSAAAVRAGDDFKQVAVRVFEVDTASAVVVIDLT